MSGVNRGSQGVGMKFLRTVSIWVFCALMGATAVAEDIDLFQGVNPDNAATVDILVVMDNAARANSSAEKCPPPKQVKNPEGKDSWVFETPFGIHQCALASVVSQLPDTQVRLGVMMFRGPQTQKYSNGTVTGCGYTSNGGCVVFPMTRLDVTGKAAFLDWLSRWDTNNSNEGSVDISASNVTVAGALQEAYAYLKGNGSQGLSEEIYSQSALYEPGVNECDSSAYLVYIGTSWDQNGQPRDAVEAGNALYNEGSVTPAKRANPPEDAQTNPLIGRQVRTVCKPKGAGGQTTISPDDVSSFTATNTSARVNFSWVGVAGADSYVIRRYQKASPGSKFVFQKAFSTFPTTEACFDQPGVAGVYQYSIVASLEGQESSEVYIVGRNNQRREFSLSGGVPTDSDCNQVSPGTDFETEILSPEKHPQASGAYQYADEWTRYLRNQLGIRTYTVGLINKDECFASYPGIMTSMAIEGGGEYFETYDFEGIENALGNIFSQILATNSVFASVSLPISVNTEDTFLNQVYIGMFRPDGDGRPRWHGNLKAYQLGFEGDELRLKDADDGRAIASSSTGFIDACARSFWTPQSGSDYWPTDEDFYANCLPEGRASQDGPDGQIVEKGGAGYGLRQANFSNRNIWTYNPSTQGLASFDTGLFSSYSATAKASMFGVTESAEVDPIVIWARGAYNITGSEDDDDFVSLGSTRPSIHGDVIHSRPKAIDFNETNVDSASAVVVFYGANDGTLRAINGNLPDGNADLIAGKAPGEEIWSFLPPEFYPELKRLRDNEVPIDFEGIARCVPPAGETEGPCEPKPYGMDGPVSAFINGEPGDVDYRVIIYATMRRGGRMIYAFDVTDIPAGDDPTLVWRFGCNDSGAAGQVVSCTHSGLDAEIGQTWSSPQPTTLANGTPVVIFGGGYDECEDIDSVGSSCLAGTRGGFVYVVHAETGVILRKFSLADSLGGGEVARPVPADVIVVPADDESGTLAYVYASDLGGNVYRISAANGQPISNSQPNSWELRRIARLGCTPSDGTHCNRKFFYPPDVIRPLSGGFVLLLGSGDREKPLPSETYPNASAVSNYFFAIYDDPQNVDVKKPQLSELQDDFSCNGAYVCMNALAPVTMGQTEAAAQQDANNNYFAGWRLALRPSEQTVTTTITVLGTSIFSTHTPETPESYVSCEANLGTARAYQVNYATGQGAGSDNQRSAEIEGGGLPPSPVAGLVKIGDEVVPFVIGANARSALEAALPGEGAFPREPKGKRYWYIQR